MERAPLKDPCNGIFIKIHAGQLSCNVTMTFHHLCSSKMEIFQYFGFYANVNFHIHEQMRDVIRGRTTVSP